MFRKKLLMSVMTHFEFIIETTLIHRHSVVMTVAVGVVRVPEELSRFPPTVIHVLWVSSSWRLVLHTICP